MLYSINHQQLTFFLVGTDELHDNLFLRWMLILRGHDLFVYTSLEEEMDEVLQHMDTTYMDVVLQCMGWPKLQWVVVFSCDTTTYILGS